jgi:hypothetical protein
MTITGIGRTPGERRTPANPPRATRGGLAAMTLSFVATESSNLL